MRLFVIVINVFMLFISSLANAEPYKVAFIPKGATHVFWKEMARGAEDVAKALNVDMVWRGPTTEDDVEAQNSIMGIYIRSRYHGLIIAPDSQTLLTKTIADAVKEGMKIVVVDSPLSANNPNPYPYVGTNNEQAGALAAKQVAADYPKARKVLVFRYSESHGSTSERERGFITTIKKLLPKAEVNASFYSGVTVEGADAKLQEILGREADFDVVFTPNESGTEGAIKALKALKLSDKVSHYGFDFSVSINEALISGALRGVVIQDPYLMGQQAMKFMLDAIEKRPVPLKLHTPALMVTAKNIASATVKAKTDPFLNLRPR